MDHNTLIWIAWAVLIVLQSITFTLVSRARNSASLTRHVVASLGSNGVWFLSQMIILKQQLEILQGKSGLWLAILTALFYCTFSMAGSVLAHWWSLRSEKGKAAVGASSKYAQVTKEEWERVTRLVNEQRCTKTHEG